MKRYSLLFVCLGILSGSGVLFAKSSAAPVDSWTGNLVSSVPQLALKADGQARTITFTNNGVDTALNVTYSVSPAFPDGTTISPATCGDILAGSTCVLTIVPGSTPSAAPGDTNPTPITLTAQGDNTNAVITQINILDYGSVYQSGFLYAVDDTVTSTASIGGKVAALTDQLPSFPNGIYWDSTIGCISYPYSGCITTNASSQIDGSNTSTGNTYLIIAALSPAQGINTYAAGVCSATIAGYSDWYLPAICEMGYDSYTLNTGCGTSESPTLQNMQSNLVDRGVTGSPLGQYWSSTEYPVDPQGLAWVQYFEFIGSYQSENFKVLPTGVRCSRVLTP